LHFPFFYDTLLSTEKNFWFIFFRLMLMVADNGIIDKVLPRHSLYMRLLASGLSQKQVAEECGLTEGRLSVIVNSPLFKLEFQRYQRRLEDKVAAIHEKIITGAEKAIDLHNEIVSGVVKMKDGQEDILVQMPLQARQSSATAIANLYLRLTKGSSLNPSDEEGETYEQKLEHEVTTKDTLTIRKQPPKEENEEREESIIELTMEEGCANA
jgi:hypothetical protein